MDAFEHPATVIENESVKKWKGAGGKVVGYSCVFTPVEILEAGGLLPYRIKPMGNSKTDLADARLSRFNCSFCRACLQLGLDGTYDFLDGLIETNGCDQLRGMFENWQYAKKRPYFHYLKVPHIISPEALDYYEVEMEKYKASVEEHFKVKITDDALWESMHRQERIRKRLRELYDMREQDKPTLTGTQALKIVLAGSSIPSDEFEKLLDDFIGNKNNGDAGQYRARLLLGGAATDEVDFIEGMETLGGLVVTDTLCYGSRAFWNFELNQEISPIRAVSEMYLECSLCPRMYDEFDTRINFLTDGMERAKANGVVLVHNKFCDVHGIDNALLRLKLEEKGVPVLILEKEYGAKSDLGRMKTRVQAFLERIGGDK